MASAVAGMGIRVSAKTGGFRKGMKRSEGVVKRFGKAVAGVGAGLLKFGAAGTALAAGALTLLTKKAFESGDELGKMADRLGIATEKLSGLQFAAQITGGSVESLNKSMVFLSKTIGEAKTGIGEGLQAFEALGLSLQSLEGLTPDEKLAKIADSFKELATREDQAFVATKLFGRAGIGMINMLDLGAEGMRELIAEAEMLGISLSGIDTAKLAIANDAVTRMKAIFQGFINQLAVQLAPLVASLTTRFVEWAKSGGGAANIVGEAFNQVVGVLASVADWLELLNAGWQTLRGVATLAILGVVGSINLLVQGLNKVAEFFGSDVLEGTVQFFDALTEGFAETASDAFDAAGESFDNFVNKVNSSKVKDFVSNVTEEIDKLAKEISDNAAKTISTSAAAVTVATVKRFQQKTLSDIGGSVSQFRQVALSRVAVGGQNARNTTNKKIDRTNELLEEVVRKTGVPVLH